MWRRLVHSSSLRQCTGPTETSLDSLQWTVVPPVSRVKGLCLRVREVILLLPLVAAFGYDGEVEHQQDDPVAGVEYRPRYQQGFLCLAEWLLCFAVDGVHYTSEQHQRPHRDGHGANEVDNDLPAARGAPSRLVDGEQGKYFGREQAGHVDQRVERHEDHDQAAAQEAGVGGLHHPNQLHRQ